MEKPQFRPAAEELPSCVEAVRLFIRVMRMHHSTVERRVCDLGIHHSQHRMLTHLTRCRENPSQKELADTFGISPAAVATTLKRMEKEGYITRSATDGDNRRNEIRITEAGQHKVEEGQEVFMSVDRGMFDGFSEEEIRTAIALLKRCEANLEAMGGTDDEPPPRRR